MSSLLPPGYQLCTGSGLDRALLVKFMQRTYQELYPNQDFSHLADMVERYFSKETLLWWVEFLGKRKECKESKGLEESTDVSSSFATGVQNLKVACLWLGNAVDQVQGDRYAHIFLLYVTLEHRRRGIATALLSHAEDWAKARGDRQIGLQVFQINHPAVNLYHQQGFQTQSLWMTKQF